MRTALLFFVIIVMLLAPSRLSSQSPAAALTLSVVNANSTQVTIKATMTIVPTLMNVEAVSVAVAYDPAKLSAHQTNTITHKYFQQYSWEDGSMPLWDNDGIFPDVSVYSEYHPNFMSQAILRNAPPDLCRFTFFVKNPGPGVTDFVVYANNPTSALTYYFEFGFPTLQNFNPVTNLFDVHYPVELTLFTGAQQGEAVALRWVTASEQNNFGFFVERRDVEYDGEYDWTTLGFVDGAGDTKSERQYFYIDNDLPRDGVFEYRLKQQDFDGTIAYSPVVTVEYNLTPNTFTLAQNFPNPVSSSNASTTLTYDVAEQGRIRLVIHDVLGRPVRTLVDETRDPGRYSEVWHTLDLPTGMYIATMTAEPLHSGRAVMRHIRMQIVR